MASKKANDGRRSSPVELVRAAAHLALDKKAEDVVILDLKRFSLDCDYFLIASGSSDPHVRAIAEGIEDGLVERCGERAWHREGVTAARWILLDYVDVVIHVFLADVRENYMLERLWGDAPIERVAAGPGERQDAGDDEPAGGAAAGAGDGT